jgi:hypothetical protein
MNTFRAEGEAFTPPSNVACRCRVFVLTAWESSGANVDLAFAHALGMASYEAGNPDHRDIIRASITSMRKQQVVLVQELARSNRILPDLYQPIVNANDALASMANFDQPLRNFNQFINPEYVLALGWAACVIPSSDDSPDAMQLTELLNDIVGLKARLFAMLFPTEVHEFAEQLLRELEQGIVTSRFEGSRMLQRACRNAAAEITEVEGLLRSAASELGDDQRNFLSEAADAVGRIDVVSGGGAAKITFSQTLMPLLKSLIADVPT